MSEQPFEFHQILPPGADDTPYGNSPTISLTRWILTVANC